jgi:hypothetical protein
MVTTGFLLCVLGRRKKAKGEWSDLLSCIFNILYIQYIIYIVRVVVVVVVVLSLH